MKTYDTKQTIIKVTELLERKKRFAFVTYTRSSFFSVFNDIKGEKKPPRNFVQSMANSLNIQDSNYCAAAQLEFIDSHRNKLNKAGLSNKNFYDSAFLENYIYENKDVFKIFMNYYIKNTNVLVVSFQSISNIGKFFSKDSAFITVPYNDFYDKLDSVIAQITEFTNEYDLAVLDCPMFGSALASKIWEKTDMSILDMGKTLTVARAADKINRIRSS